MCSTETFIVVALHPVELEKDSKDKYSSIFIYVECIMNPLTRMYMNMIIQKNIF